MRVAFCAEFNGRATYRFGRAKEQPVFFFRLARFVLSVDRLLIYAVQPLRAHSSTSIRLLAQNFVPVLTRKSREASAQADH